MILGVLDANHDRKIDKQEIENASEALAKLDGNGDGEITADELRAAAKQRQGKRAANGPSGDKKKKPGQGKKKPKKKSKAG